MFDPTDSKLDQFLALQEQKCSLLPIPRPSSLYDGKTPHKHVPWKLLVKKPLSRQALESHFRVNPDDNIAIITGKSSDLLVLDIDPHGQNALPLVNRIRELAPDSPFVITGGGGYHFYFRYDEVSTKLALLPSSLFPELVLDPEIKIDLKSDNGYVIAPPSLHRSGSSYLFHPASPPFQRPLPRLPDTIRNALLSPDAKQVPKDWHAIISKSLEGSRHANTLSLTALLLSHTPPNYWEHVILPLLRAWNQIYSKPPLPEKELTAIFNDIATKEFKKYQL